MKYTPDLVSVIIPCYNTADFLGEAIESVLDQRYENFEIIIVDDGSTDNTKQVVDSFDDNRIRYIYQKNKGLSGARNTGILNALGEYISFLDSDDFYFPNKLEDQVGYLEEHPDIGVVAGGFVRIGYDGVATYQAVPSPGVVSLEDSITENRFVVHATLIRKACIDKVGLFDEDLLGSEEWDYHSRLAINGCKIVSTEEIVCAYRLRPGSLSTDLQLQTNCRLTVCEKIYNNPLLPAGMIEYKASSLALIYLKGAIQFYNVDQIETGKSYLMHAFLYDPDLYSQNYQIVLDKILSWTGPMGFDNPIAFFQKFFRNLPSEVSGMAHCRRATLGVVAKSGLSRAVDQRNIFLGAQFLFWMLITTPIDLVKSMIKRLISMYKGDLHG